MVQQITEAISKATEYFSQVATFCKNTHEVQQLIRVGTPPVPVKDFYICTLKRQKLSAVPCPEEGAGTLQKLSLNLSYAACTGQLWTIQTDGCIYHILTVLVKSDLTWDLTQYLKSIY